MLFVNVKLLELVECYSLWDMKNDKDCEFAKTQWLVLS